MEYAAQIAVCMEAVLKSGASDLISARRFNDKSVRVLKYERAAFSSDNARFFSTDSFARRATEKEFHFDLLGNARSAFEQDARPRDRQTDGKRRPVKSCYKSSDWASDYIRRF